MATTRLDIISIGTLSRNRLWNETEPVRTPHATTTLIRAGRKNILVDPGLPPAALEARLFERTGMRPTQIDTIFLTNFRPAHRRGLPLFTNAKTFIHENEQRHVGDHLRRLIDEAPAEDIDRKLLQSELKLLESLSPAEDAMGEQVDLFPLFGYTRGTCGLLIALPAVSILLAGDAIPTQEHFLAGQLLPDSHDLEATKESLLEAYEIADLVIPGHDNLFMNPRVQGI